MLVACCWAGVTAPDGRGEGDLAVTRVLMALGILSVAYGLLMAALYPAGGFFCVWLMLGAALVAAVFVERIRLAVCVVCAAGLVAAGIMAARVWSAVSMTAPADLDYVVVLGANIKPDGSPSEALAYRLDAALEYLRENPSTVCVVSGGQGPDEVRPEADVMAEYLRAHGVAADRVVREGRSTSTEENIRYTAELLAARGDLDASVGIVTNDFHLYRALRIAEKGGLPGAHGLAARSNPLYLPHALLRECCAVALGELTGSL